MKPLIVKLTKSVAPRIPKEIAKLQIQKAIDMQKRGIIKF
jgi:hypothetical protein